jgi:group I intron endonuclease
MSKNGEIYVITNKINGKQYVGQTRKYYVNGQKYGFNKRFNKHISSSSKDDWHKKCRALYGAIRKYGKDKFMIELLCDCDEDELDDLEVKYISELNTLSPNGYNLTVGGGSGRRSDETRERMRQARLGKTLSEETKSKISKSLSGKNHPMWGKKHSKQTLKRMSEKQTKENHPMWNKNHSHESRVKISKSGRKYEDVQDLPIYLYRYNSKKNNGFKVTYTRDNKKKDKTFTRKSLSLKEKLVLAIKFYNNEYNTNYTASQFID